MVPRLCLSPFLRAGQTLSPPGSSRSLLLLRGLSLRSRDSSPPDKPVAPAGARREGPSLEQRRWEKEGEQQAGRAALIHALLGSPSLLLQGPAGALDWETRHRSKIGLLQLQIQSCSSGLSQGQSPKASQSPSPPLCWTGKKHHRVSYAVPEAT